MVASINTNELSQYTSRKDLVGITTHETIKVKGLNLHEKLMLLDTVIL